MARKEQPAFEMSKHSKEDEELATVYCKKSYNPAAEVFERVALNVRNRCLSQIILSMALITIFYGSFLIYNYNEKPFGRTELQFGVFFGFNLVIYVIPLALFAAINNFFAIFKYRPTCSCKNIKRAYRLTLESLPTESRAVKDPYKSTPFLLKHVHQIRQYLFWSYMIIALTSLILYLTGIITLPSVLPDYYTVVFGSTNGVCYFALVYVFLMSSIIVLVDKRSPNFMLTSSGRNGGSFGFAILLFLMGIIFFLFNDRDCTDELEHFEYHD